MLGRILYKNRVKLTSLPTPLEYMNNLSRKHRVHIYVKRDDVMELALGGNKVRKLEFIFADILSKKADVVITKGAFHSNHVRLTAAAAAKLGLETYLVLYPPIKPDIRGNLLLDILLGAKIVEAPSREEADKIMEEIALELEKKGRKPYIIPGGGASPIGVYGYALAFLEIIEQMRSIGRLPKYIIHASGTGATQAGLVLGKKLLAVRDTEVIGISVGSSSEQLKKKVSELATESAYTLGLDVDINPEEVVVRDNYVFGGYASITKQVVDTMKYIASTEGLILDPVYTAKAFYGLLDMIEKNEIEEESVVVFIHTGGIPITMQYPDELLKYIETKKN